jgi:NADH pyrophosphatase NudC (nudix superfamily)
VKRIALRILIGSVAFSALLGIWALLSGDFGEIQAKVMGTSLFISGASILFCPGCGKALESVSLPCEVSCEACGSTFQLRVASDS